MILELSEGGDKRSDSSYLWTACRKKRTLVIEGLNFGGQIVNSPKVENYPGLESISGKPVFYESAESGNEAGSRDCFRACKKKYVRKTGSKIIVTDQKEYPCKAVILATGVAHRHLGIPQEEALAGSGVSYCATCDGAFFRRERCSSDRWRKYRSAGCRIPFELLQ